MKLTMGNVVHSQQHLYITNKHLYIKINEYQKMFV
jgi:hypothetical protein